MSEARQHFPDTERTFVLDQLEAGCGRDLASYVMRVYYEPLCIYSRATSYRDLGEAEEIVAGFFASRLSDPTWLDRWRAESCRRPMPLRRWLLNGLCFYMREEARRRRRDRRIESDGAGSLEPEAVSLGCASSGHAGEDLELLALRREFDALLLHAFPRIGAQTELDPETRLFDGRFDAMVDRARRLVERGGPVQPELRAFLQDLDGLEASDESAASASETPGPSRVAQQHASVARSAVRRLARAADAWRSLLRRREKRVRPRQSLRRALSDALAARLANFDGASHAERQFERARARWIVAVATERTRVACVAAGQALHFEVFIRHHVHGAPYEAIAPNFGLGEVQCAGMARTASSKFRAQLGEVLREDGIDAGEIDSEIARLMEALRE